MGAPLSRRPSDRLRPRAVGPAHLTVRSSQSAEQPRPTQPGAADHAPRAVRRAAAAAGHYGRGVRHTRRGPPAWQTAARSPDRRRCSTTKVAGPDLRQPLARDRGAPTPTCVALRSKDGDGWVEMTYAELADRVARAAAGLRALGVGPGDRVVLMMRNIPEFHVVDLAVVVLRRHADLDLQLVVPRAGRLPGRPLRRQGGHGRGHGLRRALRHRARPAPGRSSTSSCCTTPTGIAGRRPAAGAAAHRRPEPVDLDAAGRGLTPDMLATVIYTSGTTGPAQGRDAHPPQHRVDRRRATSTCSPSTPSGFRAVSYLPMAHIAERMTGHYLAGVGRLRGDDLPRPVADRRLRPRGPPADDVRRAPGVGEDPRRRAGRPVGRPRGEGAGSTRRWPRPSPIVERRTAGTATTEDDETWAFLDEVAFSNVRGAGRPRRRCSSR